MSLFRYLGVALLLLSGLPVRAERVDNFRLTDAQGRSHELYRSVERKAVVLGAIGEGDTNEYLEGLARRFAPAEVQFYVLRPSAGPVPAVPSKKNVGAPVLVDEAQDITRELGFTQASDLVIAQPGKDWSVAYHGACDSEANQKAFEAALQAVIAGQPLPASGPVVNSGVTLPLAPLKTYDYAGDVAPVLQARCVSCHTEKGVGPFAMDGYERAKKRGKMMRETIRTAQMPPWHADPHYGAFQNSRALSVDERRAVLGWIAQGAAPAADGSDPLAAAAKAASPEWELGKPDLVLQLPEVEEIPAEGSIPYRYVTVPTGLTEDKWVRSFEVRPTNRAVVHHALIFVVYPKEYRHLQPETHQGLNGYFAAYLPGMAQKAFPAEIGQFLPKGSAFIFQIHYNTTGKPEQDQTEMGLYFQDAAPQKALNILATTTTRFHIPANSADTPAHSSRAFTEDYELWGASPHMHYRGSRARFDLTAPGGETRTVLNVPFYQFDWQPMYLFDAPIAMPKGSRVDFDGGFDNSKFNPRNPDPNKDVEFGEQSYEEMFIGYVALAEKATPEKYASRPVDPASYVGFGKELNADSLVGTRWLYTDEDGNIEVKFHRFGIANVGGMPGTWSVAAGTVSIAIPFDNPIPLTLVGDELFLSGTPLKRLE